MTGRQAAIAVILKGDLFLVIERSNKVRAPGKFCFPGGEVEPGESVQQAVVRELREELRVDVLPVRQIWTSKAPSECQLNWILATITDSQCPNPDPNEVADFHWMTGSSLRDHPRVLQTNQEFLQALSIGEIDLPEMTL